MPWDVQHNQKYGFIETTFNGHVTASELREAVTQHITLQKETGVTNVLADGSAVTNGPSLMAVIDLPRIFFAKLGMKRQTKMAIILPAAEKPRKLARFFETTSLNRGWFMKVFENRQSAVAWLMPDGAADNETHPAN